MTAPVVTIVIPSYQQAPYLESAIRSVVRQDYPRVELFVLDGGSTDGSIDVIRRYDDRIAWWASGPDRGQSDAIARGWGRASGEILGWLNSDDELLPGAASRAVLALDRDPGAGLAFGGCEIVDASGTTVGSFDVGPAGLAEVISRRVLIAQPAAFARASAVRAVGGIDPGLRYVMDFDLWIRLMSVSSGAFMPGPAVARYRRHAETKSERAAGAFATELVRVLDRYYRAGPATAEAHRVRRMAYAEAYLVGARAALGRGRIDIGAALRWGLRSAVADPRVALRALRRLVRPVARVDRP